MIASRHAPGFAHGKVAGISGLYGAVLQRSTSDRSLAEVRLDADLHADAVIV